MSSIDFENLSDEDATGASLHTDISKSPEGTQTIAELVDRLSWNKNRTRVLIQDGQELLQQVSQMEEEGLDLLLRRRTSERGAQAFETLLEHLSDLGFSWVDIAKMARVSVPALRKWRRGDTPSPHNRRTVAELVSLLDIIGERSPMIQDVAGWLEMRLLPEAPVTGISLLADRRFDLLLRYASGEDAHTVLEAYHPGWEETYDSPVKVFVAEDGLPGLRLSEGHG